jgi:hypothetical protein
MRRYVPKPEIEKHPTNPRVRINNRTGMWFTVDPDDEPIRPVKTSTVRDFVNEQPLMHIGSVFGSPTIAEYVKRVNRRGFASRELLHVGCDFGTRDVMVIAKSNIQAGDPVTINIERAPTLPEFTAQVCEMIADAMSLPRGALLKRLSEPVYVGNPPVVNCVNPFSDVREIWRAPVRRCVCDYCTTYRPREEE